MAHCVIGGAPPNFRSRRTSCPAEANAGTGEDDPKRSLGVTSVLLIRLGLSIFPHFAKCERLFDEHPWAFGLSGERGKL
jgi:hypothetical protein